MLNLCICLVPHDILYPLPNLPKTPHNHCEEFNLKNKCQLQTFYQAI